ncbi:MAG: hypothetical protein D6761_13250 [Candidatus Dadabacteria bacterium]|nr:MAG: hypothetical protein D6761_13250 [Candidatus Dadabacteria bacterium]
MSWMKQSVCMCAFFLSLAALAACAGPGGTDVGNPAADPDVLIAEGVSHLSNGEYEAARASFNQAVSFPAVECEANYGLVLAGVQDTADRLDTLADSVALFFGGAPGLRTAQSLDIFPVIESLLKPFESYFDDVVEGLQFVIDNDCRLTVPAGMPVEIGDPDSLIYFKARFGYEFDPAAARVGLSIFSSALAAIHFTLAHNIEIDATDLSNTIDTIISAVRGALELEVNGPGDVTQHTMISAIRSLGAIPGDHPNLLSLGDADRMAQVDNDLATALRALYHKSGSSETGLAAALLHVAATDTDTTDNFIGLVDNDNSGTINRGDSIVIGLRELHVTGLFSGPSVDGGVWVNLNSGLGNIENLIEASHEIIQTLGDQFASVDDPSIDAPRLGLGPINDIIENTLILDFFLTPLPEAVEFDFGAFFRTPTGLRSLLPVWYDDDNDDKTSPVFLVEGESWVTTDAEPYVTFGDTGHFSGSYVFEDGGVAQTLNAITLAADGVKPSELSILVPFPLPYIQYQDPSFVGVLYVDADKLPIAPESRGDGFVLADSYLVNKATTGYFSYILNEWIYKQ